MFTSQVMQDFWTINSISSHPSILKAAGQGLLAKEIIGNPNPKNSATKQGKLKPYLQTF